MRRDLGDGLILRTATPNDADALAAFNAEIHGPPDRTAPDAGIAAWTRDLMSGAHPTTGASDFTIVENTQTGAIVSSTVLIGQTWRYDDIPFAAGQPELVGTHPDFRRRGLVRTQFDVLHGWSRERGQHVLGITGIPWYYRQFGYEYALALGGGRSGDKSQVPRLADGESELFHVRPATDADLPFLESVAETRGARYLVDGVLDETSWRYELHGRGENNVHRQEWRVIESSSGEPVGFLRHAGGLWGTTLHVSGYELKPGVSFLAVTPTVLRTLQTTGAAFAARDKKEWTGFALMLGEEHPAYGVAAGSLPRAHHPYAWYLRVPDLPGFLRHIAPVLERRLASSPLAGHTGALKLCSYTSGLELTFESGRLTEVCDGPPDETTADAVFPPGVFLKLLFGYRSLADLEDTFPDCSGRSDGTRALLATLFPKRVSHVAGFA